MNFRSNFIQWFYNEFQKDPLWVAMQICVEASPWHRENSVAIHTQMVVSQYISWVDKVWSFQTLIGAVACAFHDVGKPSARVVKFKPERGEYNSFGGHEIISARLWENYAMNNLERMHALFENRSLDFIYQVGFVIEHHMPYEQPADKIQDMAITAQHLFSTPVFQNHLIADTHGRIADDHDKKIAAVDNWILQFEMKMHKPFFHRIDEGLSENKLLILPIGAAGSGKSTLFKKLSKETSLIHYSWDNLRLEWYDSDYTKAYKKSVDDPHFNARYMKVFKDQILTGKSIFVDNTNLSRKRRRPWIIDARKHGYSVVAYIMPITLDTLVKRQKTRLDKDVPVDSVRQHYMTLQLPLYGEVDDVRIHTGGI